MNNTCTRCDGTGQETFFDERWETDICYHCSGSGKLDDQTAFYDQLGDVARTLAGYTVSEMERAQNENPDGESWDFCAAENMMSGYEYFRLHVESYAMQYMDRLLEMTKESQQLLVAWNNLPTPVKTKVEKQTPPPSYYAPEMNWADNDDDILF